MTAQKKAIWGDGEAGWGHIPSQQKGSYELKLTGVDTNVVYFLERQSS